jgi:hypothetical protein
MSFMDKVKAQAEQAMVKGQQAVQQGQTKLGEMQAAKASGSNDGLLRDLGAAYYAEQRSGGSPDATATALAALDAHAAAAQQAAEQAAAAAAAPPAAPATPAPSIIDGATPPPAPPAPAGPAPSFGLDDV